MVGTEELICQIIAELDKLPQQKEDTYSKAEVEQLRQAHTILTEKIKTAPTIKELAKLVGLNETKLQHGFKSLFGETIFQYRNKVRMAKAMQLIKEDMPIGLVAERVGYKQMLTAKHSLTA